MMPECKRCGEELVRDVCPCCEPGLLIVLDQATDGLYSDEIQRQQIFRAALGDEAYEKLSSNHDKGDDPE